MLKAHRRKRRALAALPSQIERELVEGLRVLLLVTLPWLSLDHGFTRRGRTLSPPAMAFMDLMRKIEREPPAGKDAKRAQKADRAD